MSILKIRDADGNVQEILAIKGDKGDDYVLTPADKEEIAGMVDIDTLMSTSQAYLPPTRADMEYCQKIINLSVPYDARYDVNNDGFVDATDLVDMYKAVRGEDDMSTWPNMEYSDVTV